MTGRDPHMWDDELEDQVATAVEAEAAEDDAIAEAEAIRAEHVERVGGGSGV